MDFSWNDEQLSFRRAVDRLRTEGAERRIDRARSAGRVLARELAQVRATLASWACPSLETYGGADADILTTMLAMEGLGYGCRDNGLIFAMNAQMWSVQMPILSLGTEAQKRKYLPGLCRGEIIGAHGMSEPGLRLRCLQPTHAGRADRRWLCAERQQDVRHQRAGCGHGGGLCHR